MCMCAHIAWVNDSPYKLRICYFMQISKDPRYFNENNMEIHVKLTMDEAKYSRSSSFCLLSFSIFNRDYTLSPAGNIT